MDLSGGLIHVLVVTTQLVEIPSYTRNVHLLPSRHNDVFPSLCLKSLVVPSSFILDLSESVPERLICTIYGF